MTWAQNLKLSKKLNDLKDNTDLYTILRDKLPFVDKRGVIKAQCVVDRWVGILRRHIPLGLLCYKTRSRFETPFRWKVLLDIEDEIAGQVNLSCEKRLQDIPQNEPPSHRKNVI